MSNFQVSKNNPMSKLTAMYMYASTLCIIDAPLSSEDNYSDVQSVQSIIIQTNMLFD